MQKLLIEDDEGKTVVVPLIRDEITIGRQEGNTIRLSEQNVSRATRGWCADRAPCCWKISPATTEPSSTVLFVGVRAAQGW